MKVVIELAGGNWFTLYHVSKIAPDGNNVIFYQGDRGDIIANVEVSSILGWSIYQGFEV